MEIHVSELVASVWPYRETARREFLMDRGRAVHEGFLGLLKGLWIPSKSDEVNAIVEALLAWSRLYWIQDVRTEVPISDHSAGLILLGTPDILCRDREGTPLVIDIKVSASVSFQAKCQVTLYQMMLSVPHDGLVVAIKPEGLKISAWYSNHANAMFNGPRIISAYKLRRDLT